MSDKGKVVVIGSGAAGSSAARTLASAGWHVTLAERGRWGGTCLWYGCIPKKSLYHSARRLREMRAAEEIGVRCTGIEVDWPGVLAWKWHAQETWAGDQKALLSAAGIHLAEGTARFVSTDAIEIAGARHEFDHAVIATGASSAVPQIPGAELCDTSNDALRYSELPGSLVIVGGGFIALELAGIYASFGTQVTVVTRPQRILEMLDEDLAAEAERRLGELGVAFYAGCSVTGVEGELGELRVLYTDGDGERHVLDTERVLMAVGRKPSLEELGLDAAEVAVDDRGALALDEYGRTTNPAVWAIGDASGGQMHTPVAYYEGRVVAQSIDSGHPTHADCSAVPYTCFTHPELAIVGLTELAAAEQNREVAVRKLRFDGIGAGVIEDWRDGFVKVLVDPTSRVVLGVQVAGPSAADVIYAGAVAVKLGMTAKQLGETLAVHPSFAEGLHFAGE